MTIFSKLRFFTSRRPLPSSLKSPPLIRDGNPITVQQVSSLVRRLLADESVPDGDILAMLAAGGDGRTIFQHPPCASEIRDAFDFFDKDGDGQITAVELLQVFTAIGDERCTLDECRRMIRGVDTNVRVGARARVYWFVQNQKKKMGDVNSSEQFPPWTRLENKVVMVTGASSGIGRELCLDLAKAGCLIIAAARRVHRLRSLCDEINGAPGNCHRAAAIELDVTANSATVESAVTAAWDAFSHIDVLVNNAGISNKSSVAFDEIEEEQWDRLVKTNLKGAWMVSKFVFRLMRESNKGGSVINISSIAGVNRGILPGSIGYACSKAGLNTMTKTMALEFGKHNIRVNSISPGLFTSEITSSLMTKKWMGGVMERIVPLKTYGTVHPAMTSLVRYLIHHSSSYVTGNSFIVDSGATLPGLPLFSSL